MWFLPIEWVDQSYKAKKLLPEAEHDFEKLEMAKRETRAEELATAYGERFAPLESLKG